MSVQPQALDRVRQQLKLRRSELLTRRQRVDRDLGRCNDPLSPDSSDQAIQVQNDEPLQAIGQAAAEEITAIDAALERLSMGLYGVCTQCGERIEPARLAAVAHAVTCTACASD